MKVGFIGLGTMGASMASNCQKGGYDLVVHDVRREAATPHLEAGAAWADTPRQLAEDSEVIFTSLPGPMEVEAVALGEDGIKDGIGPGKVYFDLSTSSPTLIRRIHQVMGQQGAHVLDAPVSGGPEGARTRNLAIWVGGDELIYERYKHVLDSIGDKAYYVGPIGSGSIAKLVHNCAGYIFQGAIAEVFTMGVKAGVEPLALWQAVRKGAHGRRGPFERMPDHLVTISKWPDATVAGTTGAHMRAVTHRGSSLRSCSPGRIGSGEPGVRLDNPARRIPLLARG